MHGNSGRRLLYLLVFKTRWKMSTKRKRSSDTRWRCPSSCLQVTPWPVTTFCVGANEKRHDNNNTVAFVRRIHEHGRPTRNAKTYSASGRKTTRSKSRVAKAMTGRGERLRNGIFHARAAAVETRSHASNVRARKIHFIVTYAHEWHSGNTAVAKALFSKTRRPSPREKERIKRSRRTGDGRQWTNNCTIALTSKDFAPSDHCTAAASAGKR